MLRARARTPSPSLCAAVEQVKSPVSSGANACAAACRRKRNERGEESIVTCERGCVYRWDHNRQAPSPSQNPRNFLLPDPPSPQQILIGRAMPPRKRPPPPTTTIKPAMPPPPSKRRTVESVPAPAAASASDSSSAPSIPPISGDILKILPETQRKIYELVYAAGSTGMCAKSLQHAMNKTTVSKHTGALVKRCILKEVTDVRNRRKKVFMDARIDPSTDIGGGFWYHNGKIDPDALAAARRSCLDQVSKLGAATPDMVRNGIVREDPRLGYKIDQVREVLRTMVLDRLVEECRSTGEGEFSAVRVGMVCYRRCCAPQGGMVEGIPCGVCPRIADCSPDAVISPTTCVYFKKWLQLDF